MTPYLLSILCDPKTKSKLRLENPIYLNDNYIISGELVSEIDNNHYPIINGIPRFTEDIKNESVNSFGDEWNYFDFIDYKINWLEHTVKNTFGNITYFKDKIILDAGAGSGSQSKWFLESGAKHVIALELSHSVDGVLSKNLKEFKNVDILQCSIDNPPLLINSIPDIVYCHNVIQHTESVEKTANELWNITSVGGEFVFNCYPLNDKGFFRRIRHHLIYSSIRRFISSKSFNVIRLYSLILAVLRQLPILGYFLEKSGFCVQGDVPSIENENIIKKYKRRFKCTYLNTFDAFGSHKYQHHIDDDSLIKIVNSLQPDPRKIGNFNLYFSQPKPVGIALRLFK